MNRPRTLMKKALVGWLVYSLGFNPLWVASAYAVSNDYSDTPLPAKKRPLPNLLMAIDDSGSMDFETSLNGNDGSAWWHTGDGRFHGRAGATGDPSDFVAMAWGGTGTPNFNVAGNPNDTWKKFTYLFPNGYGTSTTSDLRSLADGDDSHFAIAPTAQFAWLRSPAYNKQYYNPAVTYEPWKAYNPPTFFGSACPAGTVNGSGTTFRCNPNPATWTAARSHPLYPSSGAFTFNVTATQAANQSNDFHFRMYAGMIVPSGATYRVCSNTGVGSGCGGALGSWTTAATNLCLFNSSDKPGAASCTAMGMAIGANLDMSGRNHAEVAIAYYMPTYYVQDDAVAAPDAYGPYVPTGATTTRLRRVEVRPATTSYVKAATRKDCLGTDCTYTEEMQNFANWVQYYRKRSLSLNGAIGNALDSIFGLRGGYFVFNNTGSPGYHTNASAAGSITMYDFDSTDTTKNDRRLLGGLYAVRPNGGTPTRVVLDRLGRRFMDTGANQVMTAPCQFNGGFIITDGFANPSGDPTWSGNYDANTAGATATPVIDPTNYPYNTPFASPINPAVTAPYRDNWSNTMADMAMYFYTKNLRPDYPAGKVPVNVNDLTPDADRNPNPHMNLYGLILGLSGRIFKNPAFPAENANPYTTPPNWNTTNPTALVRDPGVIDELWHATINGRGSMLKADSPEETRNAVLDVVNSVVAKGGAAAAVSVSNANPVPGDNFTYQTSYNAGPWSGDVNAFEIDLATGVPSSTPAWTPSPQQQLAERTWNDAVTPRRIATYNGTTGIPFQWANLTAAQQTSLTGLAVGAAIVPGIEVLEFLRGERTNEGTFMRSRGPRKDAGGLWPGGTAVTPTGISVLGDVVNAEPLIVNAPNLSYLDAGYAAFRTANAGRTKMLYIGANDGKLHAFSTIVGKEEWAYVPSSGFLSSTGASTPNSGYPGSTVAFAKKNLRNLADKEFFTHTFYVDGTPIAADFDLDKANSPAGTGTPQWRTYLVGGLGKGGRSYYALDVTSPIPSGSDDTAIAGMVKWEFPNAATAAHLPNVGYTYGRPVMVKTKAAGWVVLVASGYENGNETAGDGRGHLYVLNPLNGAVIADLTTIDSEDGVADPRVTPLGLAHISAFAPNGTVDATVDFAYGGDLYGNVWRFDLSGASVASWNVKRLATLTDVPGNRQPITTEPELGIVLYKGTVNRMVYVGAGRYYGDKDIPGATGAFTSATGKQTLYALKDDLSAAPLIGAPRTALVSQTIAKSGGFASLTSNPVDLLTSKGWYVDFPDTGERVITNPQLALGVLAVTTNIPDGSDPCIPGGRSWFYAIDYRTGGTIPGATYAGKSLGDALASRVVFVRLPNGKLEALIRMTDASTRTEETPLSSANAAPKRKSWREILVTQ